MIIWSKQDEEFQIILFSFFPFSSFALNNSFLLFDFQCSLHSFLLLSAIFIFFSLVFFMEHFSYWISFFHSFSILQIIISSMFYLIRSFLTKCKIFLFLFFFISQNSFINILFSLFFQLLPFFYCYISSSFISSYL